MIIYKTTNQINGRYYIGKNKTNDPNYLGSGKLLHQAFKKYGKENFVKEILEICNNEDHLNEREKYWISQSILDPLCYNIGQGGEGGDNITFNPNRQEFLEKMKIINSTQNGMSGKKHRPESREKLLEKAKDRFGKQWYINRYGEEEGLQKFENRCKWLSDTRIGSGNPAYKFVDEQELTNYILNNPTCKLKDIVDFFNVGSTCIYGKFKEYYNSKNIKEVRNFLDFRNK